jgi:NADPH:quinone reductase
VREARGGVDVVFDGVGGAIARAAVIGQRFPLERAADAHAAIESRATVGKTLLEVAARR